MKNKYWMKKINYNIHNFLDKWADFNLHLYCCFIKKCGNKMSKKLSRYQQCYQPEACFVCKKYKIFHPFTTFTWKWQSLALGSEKNEK